MQNQFIIPVTPISPVCKVTSRTNKASNYKCNKYISNSHNFPASELYIIFFLWAYYFIKYSFKQQSLIIMMHSAFLKIREF